MSGKRVLLIGLASSAVDFDKWPELSVEILEDAFRKVQKDLESAGFEAAWCLVQADDTAAPELEAALRAEPPDVAMIGAGVRADEDQLLLFEQLVNVIHREAPDAAIAFNRNPLDSVDAVRRWA
ncbi:MAG: hypothetical protein QNK05_18030 [Myxococcota bacterium]|nr:hypothetical protein [Myxococcota bacterium]